MAKKSDQQRVEKKVDCFACFTKFDKVCWIHPLYPGERVCEACYKKIRIQYKYLLK